MFFISFGRYANMATLYYTCALRVRSPECISWSVHPVTPFFIVRRNDDIAGEMEKVTRVVTVKYKVL